MNPHTQLINFPQPCNVIKTKLKNRRIKVARGLNGYGLTFKNYVGGREITTTKIALSNEAMAAVIAAVLRLETPHKCQCGADIDPASAIVHPGQDCGYRAVRLVEGPTVDLEQLTSSQKATSMAPYGWIIWEKK